MKKLKVSDKEIEKYYSKAISRKINELARKYLGKYYSKKQIGTIVKIITDYYVISNKENYNKLISLYCYFTKVSIELMNAESSILAELNIRSEARVMDAAFGERSDDKLKPFVMPAK